MCVHDLHQIAEKVQKVSNFCERAGPSVGPMSSPEDMRIYITLNSNGAGASIVYNSTSCKFI